MWFCYKGFNVFRWLVTVCFHHDNLQKIFKNLENIMRLWMLCDITMVYNQSRSNKAIDWRSSEKYHQNKSSLVIISKCSWFVAVEICVVWITWGNLTTRTWCIALEGGGQIHGKEITCKYQNVKSWKYFAENCGFSVNQICRRKFFFICPPRKQKTLHIQIYSPLPRNITSKW